MVFVFCFELVVWAFGKIANPLWDGEVMVSMGFGRFCIFAYLGVVLGSQVRRVCFDFDGSMFSGFRGGYVAHGTQEAWV